MNPSDKDHNLSNEEALARPEDAAGEEADEALEPAVTRVPATLKSGRHKLKHILEAALLASDQPLTVAQLGDIFEESDRPPAADISRALEALAADCADRGVELQEVASGWRYQVKFEVHDFVARLWTERPARYSRAMLETLALIAYRQPITRGEIESVRGVSLSSNIVRSLQEREWIRIVGHRDVPGKPALFGTTRVFLDYFNLSSLDQMPTLAEIRDMDTLDPELQFDPAPVGASNAREQDQNNPPNPESEEDREHGSLPPDE
jgi:segregation and condensation protein B